MRYTYHIIYKLILLLLEGKADKISRRDILPMQSAGLFLNHWLRVQSLGYCHSNANMRFRNLLFRAAYAEHSKTSSLQAAWICRGCQPSGPSCLIIGLQWGRKSSQSTQILAGPQSRKQQPPPYRCEQPTHNASGLFDAISLQCLWCPGNMHTKIIIKLIDPVKSLGAYILHVTLFPSLSGSIH